MKEHVLFCVEEKDFCVKGVEVHSGLGKHSCTISEVFKPKNELQLKRFIGQAYIDKQPFYPISKGNNWGYGYKSPASDGCILLDMSEMNRILNFDEELGVVEIEPGVTQGQLAEYLKHSKWMLDCTGAGPDTSLVGNILERGFGHGPVGNRSRHFTISELILSTGEVFGLNHSIRYCGRAGLSANLHELFTQNNIAVISKMKFELMLRPQSSLRCLVRLNSPNDLCEYIEIMRQLKSEGSIDGLPHLANSYRILTMMERFNFDKWDPSVGISDHHIAPLCKKHGITPWSGAFLIAGTREVAKAKAKRVKKLLKPIAQVNIVSFNNLNRSNILVQGAGKLFGRIALYRRLQNSLNDFTKMMDMFEGNPKDLALKGCYWRYDGEIPEKMDPVIDGAGFFWVAPSLPMLGDEVEKCMRLTKQAFDKVGFEFGVTITAVSPHMCQAIISIYYNANNSEETDKAAELRQKLSSLYQRYQWPCYRRSVDEMPFDSEHELEPEALILRKRIKLALDTDNILAPGRYQMSNTYQIGEAK